MGLLDRLFKQRTRDPLTPADSSLAARIASPIKAFTAVRGLKSLLGPETAVVLRGDREIFVTQHVDNIQNRESIKALVYLKDVKSYEQFKEIQATELSRGDTLGHRAIDFLAEQVARRLQKK